MPGSVELAHLRNPRPDIAAARAAGEAAVAAAVAAGLHRRVQHNAGAADLNVHRLNVYVKGFRLEMQRQYDAHAQMPRCGDTEQLLQSFFFAPYNCQGLSQAAFVAWQVKVALGLLPPGRPPGA